MSYNREKLVKLSRFISCILRHKPHIIGIELDKNGWARTDALIEGINNSNRFITMDMLNKIVKTDEKQRYSFNSDKSLIRANQGHSVNVQVDLKEMTPPDILYHGTGKKYCESIDKTGLIPKGRLYVHLSKDKETAYSVGSRHGEPVIYIVHAKEMHNAGFKFYLSKNNVWLIERVPHYYLEKVIDSFKSK